MLMVHESSTLGWSTLIKLLRALTQQINHFELGFSQPVICAKYAYMDECHGLFSTYGPQISHDWCGLNGFVLEHLAQQYGGSAAHNTYTNIKKSLQTSKDSSKIFVDVLR